MHHSPKGLLINVFCLCSAYRVPILISNRAIACFLVSIWVNSSSKVFNVISRLLVLQFLLKSLWESLQTILSLLVVPHIFLLLSSCFFFYLKLCANSTLLQCSKSSDRYCVFMIGFRWIASHHARRPKTPCSSTNKFKRIQLY